MTAKNLQNLPTYLEDTGFIQKDEQVFSWAADQERSPHRQHLPWRILDWSLQIRDEELVQISFEALLLRDELVQNLGDMLKKRFESFRTVALQEDQKSGFWLLFEFLDRPLDADQSRLIEQEELQRSQLPHGLAGLHLTVIQALGQISVFMTKHFFLGNVPGQLFLEFPKLMTEALFGDSLKDRTNFNAYITTVGAEEIRKLLIDASQMPEFVLQSIHSDPQKVDTPFQQVHLQFKEQAWSLVWSQKEELPVLIVPPIEVLEQKEVARRFQAMDELILVEDYHGAMAQCREYLSKNPSSLYLIRRWALFSLWGGLPFEKNYLDLMSRFDPGSLMTLSLWVRKSLQENALDPLLENLSKLGNNLGDAIVDFGELDITSLTLPEMLGDAWNEKDDQRAVSCYERVLQTRGEVPRILVKLIRLMRDIDDSTAEESYMDRLLACEVPIRTRAAIYFRLAEIKQAEDLEEAAVWALKSWQTNRLQVKYAALAADLLIALDRSHEAVHVLVETCELLPAEEPLLSKIELELKIATIWLKNLQRLDLAQERLERARDLCGDDAAAYDLILPLASELDEPVFYAELLMQALQLASKAQEHERADHIVKALLALADKMSDGEQLGRVYSLILTCSLLDVRQIENILQRPNLGLPYEKILQAMDWELTQLEAAQQGHYLLLMGDIARQYIRDNARARVYYERALEHGHLSEAAFNYLDEEYARNGLNRQRYELLKHRLMAATDTDRKLILRELYYFDDGVSDQERDHFAIEMFAMDADDVGPLEERIAFYELQGNAVSIHELVLRVVDASEQAEALKALLRLALQALQNTSSEYRYRFMDEVLQNLQALNLDRMEHAKLALSVLWSDSQKSFVRPYLEYMLNLGEVPDLEPQLMLDVLSDGESKIGLLLRLAAASTDLSTTIAYEKQAFRIAKGLSGHISLKLEIVQRMAEHLALNEDEIGEYVKAVRQSGKSQYILRILGQQIPQAKTDVMRDKLYQLSCEFLGLATADTLGLELFHDAIGHMGTEQQNRLKTIWLERIGFDGELHSKEFAIQMLRDKSFWEQQKATAALLKQLLEVWRETTLVQGIVTPILKALIDDDRESDLRFFINYLIPTGLVGQSTSLAAFEYFATRRDTAAMERYWLHSLELLENGEQTQKFLDYSRDLLQEIGMTSFLFERIAELFDQNKLVKYPAEVQREMRIFYADHLYAHTKDMRKALALYEQVYAGNMNETRVWGPLIVLYREFNADTDLYELLHRILPSLRRNQGPLRRLNLEWDSLENDMYSIAERLGLRPEPADYNSPINLQFSADSGSEHALIGAGTLISGGTQQMDIEGPTGIPVPRPALPVLTADFQTDNQETKPRSAVTMIAGDGEVTESNLDFAKFIYGAKPDPMETKATTKLPTPPMKFSTIPPLAPPVLQMDLEQDSYQVPVNVSGIIVDEDEPHLSTLISERADVIAEEHADTLIRPRAENTEVTLVLPEAVQDDKVSAPTLIIAEADQRIQNPFEQGEWRIVANQGKAKDGLCLWLLNQPLPDKTEQHVAVQVAAVFEESLHHLEKWPHKVWRQPTDYFYELKWADRMGREMFHPGIKSPLARLLKTLHPIVVHQFGNHMNLKGIADRLKIRPDELQKLRKPLDWKDDVIQRSGLRYYVKFLVENSYQIFNLHKLEDRFQFNFERREIFIDREYYLKVPPTHLFHRLAFLIRAVNLEYYPFLHLSPNNDIFPFLMKCRRSLEQSRGDSFKRLLGMEKDSLKLMLSQADRDYLEQLFVEVGPLSPDKITKIIGVYVDQIYRLNMAETLDLVGLIESISNTNLLTERISPLALVNQSASIRTMIAFTADLKFTFKAQAATT